MMLDEQERIEKKSGSRKQWLYTIMKMTYTLWKAILYIEFSLS